MLSGQTGRPDDQMGSLGCDRDAKTQTFQSSKIRPTSAPSESPVFHTWGVSHNKSDENFTGQLGNKNTENFREFLPPEFVLTIKFHEMEKWASLARQG